MHKSGGSFLSGVSDGQAAGSATTVEEACEGCTRAVHESGTSGARERCTRLRSGARDCGVVHDGTRVEVPMARQREMPQQLRKLVSSA